MKRVLALIGLLVVGVLLLSEPDTGLVAVVPSQTAETPSPLSAPSTTSGEPPITTTLAPVGTSVLGDSVNTRFGAFQVKIVVEDGHLVDVVTVSEPNDRRSRRINEAAIPLYEEAAVSTQSADVDVISGVTVTWRAYTESLRSALDQAGL